MAGSTATVRHLGLYVHHFTAVDVMHRAKGANSSMAPRVFKQDGFLRLRVVNGPHFQARNHKSEPGPNPTF